MKRTTTLVGLVLLGLGLATAGACVGTGEDLQGESPSDESVGFPSPGRDTPAQRRGAPSASVAPGGSGAIDVAQDSRVSLGLLGGLGPIVEGQTITKAMVSVQDMELVGEERTTVPLFSGGVTTDLLALENSLQSLAQDQTIRTGHYTDLRFRLTGAWIQTVDAQSAAHVFASQGVDQSQFASVGSVGRLEFGGIGPDGFVSVALPQGGIAVQGSASLAVQFALAESLSMQSTDTWILAPQVWAVDASQFSSLDVQFDLASESYSQSLTQGFQVMLFDANMWPVCEAPVTVVSSTLVAASFRYVTYFQGPFVAVLVPPSGVSLQSAIACSVDVRPSVHAEAHFRVNSLQQVGSGTFDVRTDDRASITERTQQGQVVAQTSQPVGPIDQVAPRTGPHEPVLAGEQPPGHAPIPKIPGLPGGGRGGTPNTMPQPGQGMPQPGQGMPQPGQGMPQPGRGGRPAVEDAWGPPSGRDAGRTTPSFDPGGPGYEPGTGRPARDAGGPPSLDAGGRPSPPGFDAGARQTPSGPVPPPPRFDAGAPTTGYGQRGPSGAPPASVPRQSAGAPLAGSVSGQTAGSPPPRRTAGSQPRSSVDKGAPAPGTSRPRGTTNAGLE